MTYFDDLVPRERAAAKGTFDDLLPQSGGTFDDLLPKEKPLYQEIPTQIVGGVRDAIQQNSVIAEQLLSSPVLKNSLPGLAMRAGKAFTEATPERAQAAQEFRTLPEVPEPTRLAGQITRPISQFATDFVPLFKAARSLGLANAIRGTGQSKLRSGAATLVEGEIAGLAADQVAFDPYDPRLSNLVQEYPALENPVTEYLAADPDDSEAEARLKVALEGVGLSALFTPIVAGVSSGLRGFRKQIKPSTNAATDAQRGGAPEDVDRLTIEDAPPVERAPEASAAPQQTEAQPEAASGLLAEEVKQKPAARSTKSVQPENDTLLEALSKLSNSRGQRGLSREAAESMGLDPENFKALGHGINRPFTRNGMDLDEAAQLLDEMGYPVRDAEGNYNPNTLMEKIQEELSGKPVRSIQQGDAALEQMRNEALEARYGTAAPLHPLREDEVVDWYSEPSSFDMDDPPVAPRLFAAETYDEGMGELGMQLADLASIAARYDADAAEAALERPDDAAARQALLNIIEEGRQNAQTIEATSAARTEEGTISAGAGKENAAASRGAASEIGERRQNIAERKRIDELSPEEARQLLGTSDVTGLPNRRAYKDAPKKPVQVALDVDSLKFVNDKMGHEAGDALLSQVGKALKDAGLDAYHVSGDEFIVQGAKREEIEEGLKRARAILEGKRIRKGERSVVPGFSYGVGPTIEQADAALMDAKRLREASGQRASRGNPPPSFEGPAMRVRPVDAGAPEDLLRGEANQAGSINLSKIESPEDVRRAIAETASRFPVRMDEARRGRISDDELRLLANQLGMTPEKLSKRLRGEAFNAEQAFAARSLLVDSAIDLVQKGKAAASGADDALVAFRSAFARHVAIQEQIAGLTAEAGRSFRQFKLAAQKGSRQAQIKEVIEGWGGRDTIEQLAEMVGKIEDQTQLNKFTREANKARTGDMLLEAWINSLLSGPATQAVNILSNSLVALWTLPEHMLAATIGATRGATDRVYGREVLGRAFGIVQGGKDGLRLAVKTFLTEEPSDMLSKIEARKYQAIPSLTLRRGKQPKMLGDIPIPFTGEIQLGGKQVRIPGRALQAGDEFFKAIGYRMELNAQAMRSGLQKGLKGDDLAKHISEVLNDPPRDLHLAAIDAARYQTFTRKLGDIGQGVQKIANAHPSLRLVLPFIRTPANIVKFAAERTPFGLLMKEVRDNIRAGGATRDIQLSRLAFGSIVGSVVASMAAEGHITGGGPADPRLRAALRETGWQPYSVKVGDKYYSYSRLEPLGVIFGLSADFSEIAGEMDEAEAGEVAAMITGSISKNLTSKTWLRGVSELIEAVEDPDRYGERYIQGLAGTLVPTGVAHYARTKDPVLRQTETVLDKLKSRTPGYSHTLPPRLNVWGDPILLTGGLGPDMISPIYTSRVTPDKLSDEIVRLKVKLSMPNKEIHGVRLSPEEHNEYVRLAGGPAKRLLNELVESPAWAKMNDAQRRDTIKRVITATRESARKAMIPRIGANRLIDARFDRAGIER